MTGEKKNEQKKAKFDESLSLLEKKTKVSPLVAQAISTPPSPKKKKTESSAQTRE